MELLKATNNDFGYLKIIDLYSNKELDDIFNEISHLDYILDKIHSDPSSRDRVSLGRAKDKDGVLQMTGDGLFLDEIYLRREYSSILTYNRKLFSNKLIGKYIKDSHPANNVPYININKDKTILNRYLNTQEYLPHTDSATFTAITVLLHNPEQLHGGEFCFDDYDIALGCVHNSCVIFPSWVKHSVNNLHIFGDSKRYSIAQLMYVT